MRPEDVDINLRARVSSRPCSNQTVPVHALLKEEQAQISWQSKQGWPSSAPHASGGDLSHTSWTMLHWLCCAKRGLLYSDHKALAA